MFGNIHFDILKKTVLYIHGYGEGSKHESVSTIVDAYLQRNDHNILVLDWCELANGNYLVDAVPNVKQVLNATSQKCDHISDTLITHHILLFEIIKYNL